MRILLAILLLCFNATAQRNVLMGGANKAPSIVSAGGGGYTRQNLELEYTTEQSDAVTNYTISSPPPTNNYFQALEKQTGYTYIERQSSIVRAGGWATKYNVNSSFPLDDRLRTEQVYFSEIVIGDIRRYTVSVYLPEDFDLTGTDWIECIQWHAWENRTPITGYDRDDGAKISPVGLYMDPATDKWDLNIAWNASNPTTGWDDIHVDLGAIAKGVWIDWEFYMKWDYDGDGVTTVWKDGVQVYTRNGANCYNDAHAPYFKCGLHTPSSGKTNSIFLDEIRIGNASSTHDDVAPDGFVYNRIKLFPDLATIKHKRSIGNTKVDWIRHYYLPGRKNLSKHFV